MSSAFPQKGDEITPSYLLVLVKNDVLRMKERSASEVSEVSKGKVQKRKIEEKKLTCVSFMYVCVAVNGEMLFFFIFFPNNSLIDNSLSE